MRAWEEFLKSLEQDLGRETVDSWLRVLKVIHFDACNLYLEAETPFQVLWFEEHIREKARLRFQNENERQIKIHLTNSDQPQKEKARKKKQKTDSPLFVSDPIDSKKQLSNFLPGLANQVPYQFIDELIKSSEQRSSKKTSLFNPVYIYGHRGSGKTHLLMAIANSFKEKNLCVLFVEADTFTKHLVMAIRNNSMQEFRRSYRTVDILIIDNIHIFDGRNATQEEFFHTFNTLQSLGKQIILSAHTSPYDLRGIEERLISRFEWGIVLQLGKLSSQELSILIEKQYQKEIVLWNQEVLLFLIHTFSNNISSLIHALTTLIQRVAKEHYSSIGINEVEFLLRDLIEKQKALALDPAKIIKTVAHFYEITNEDILGKSQSQDCSFPRQIAMYLCRKELKMPFTKIGSTFSRDHSTVMTSVKHIHKNIENGNQEILTALNILLRRLRE